MVRGKTQANSYADKARLPVKPSTDAPAVILVEPQLGENIGTAARAMMNCALTDLRLVDPKQDWLSEKAIAAASGADDILRNARRFNTTEEAIADLETVYATTARRREMVKTVMTARTAAGDIRARAAAGQRIGLLFGRERIGLTNHELGLANIIIEVPLNPEHSSLNLAQAVLVVGYEWFQAGYDGPDAVLTYNNTKPVTKDQLQELFDHFEKELILCGFLRHEEKRPSMIVNLRNLLQRAELSEQEVRTLHGIIKELRYGRRPDRPKRQPGYKVDERDD
ncbi:MAG: RNA methyltransferase [Rhodospirillaceae bacterium]|nr:RNA methyltransferase [Rhodospirillaceae bacterium]